jgi:hypothetical protein
MSDFDKEAERERLREKYERDQEKREATEQMSELLLKGATMTNAHCDDCGDPIFRYEGEEFCPTCQEVVTDGEAATGDPDSTDDPAEGSTDAAGTGPERAGGDAVDRRQGASPTDATQSGGPSAGSQTSTPGRETTASPAGGADTDTPADRPASRPAPQSEDPLADARASLVRTLYTQARQAETCDDPRRAKDHLAAAREAAETLAALY